MTFFLTVISFDSATPAYEQIAVGEYVQVEIADNGANMSDTDLSAEEKILVVDDVVEQREVATVMLKKLVYNVSSAPSVEEALEVIKANE